MAKLNTNYLSFTSLNWRRESPLLDIGLKLCYSYVEWTVAGIEPRTFLLQTGHLP